MYSETSKLRVGRLSNSLQEHNIGIYRAVRALNGAAIKRSIFHNTMRLRTVLVIWRQRAEQRRLLAQLDSHALKDMGISQFDAQVEANKPFWQS